jgi:hypothetical protein
MVAMRRAIIAAALFFGSLLPAWADNRVYIDHRRDSDTLHTGSKACQRARATQTSGAVTSRETIQCLRAKDGRQTVSDYRLMCTADVLHSEELPGAPIFYHLMRVTLLIRPPRSPAFQTTLQNLISWQVPPPRQGQRFRLSCDPVSLDRHERRAGRGGGFAA